MLRDARDGTRIVDEEQFGPALPVIAYTDLDDAVQRANATTYGLSGSVWSTGRRPGRCASRPPRGRPRRINSHGRRPSPEAPFGGVKWSGVGVENGPWGLEEYTDLHVTEIGATPQ